MKVASWPNLPPIPPSLSRFPEALTFDDVLLVPQASSVLPAEADTSSKLTKSIKLGVPLSRRRWIPSPNRAWRSRWAQAGGIGVIHRNMTPEHQAEEVRRVKRFESGMVVNPITIAPNAPLISALRLMADFKISGIPVCEASGKLVGILTNRDVRFATDMQQPVAELMTKDKLITVREGVSADEVKRLLHQNRIEKILVVDDAYRCIGLITVKDIEKARLYPNACKDEKGRLRVAAATGTGESGLLRAAALFDAGVDVLIIDTAHGHSDKVLEQVRQARRLSNATQIIAGNIATGDAAKALIDAGAGRRESRHRAGIDLHHPHGGGRRSPSTHRDHGRGRSLPQTGHSGDRRRRHQIIRAISSRPSRRARIARCSAACSRAPTKRRARKVLYQGRAYKTYRGMGSLGAMAKGSADRYFQKQAQDPHELVPEGVEGRVPYKGPVGQVVHQLAGGLRAAMGYTGAATIEDLQKRAKFVRITGAGLKESHVHDIQITAEAPNYRVD